jgi:hypothetical protein
MGLLAAACVVFAAWHGWLAGRVVTGMDEELFGITGTTILRTGIPAIPYIPTRDLKSFYFGVDVCCYVLPPFSFYVQAVFNGLLGDGIAGARWASICEGLIAAWVVWMLWRIWLGGNEAWGRAGREAAGLEEGLWRQGVVGGGAWAGVLYLFGRCAMFPATTARPDMLATLCGLLAVLVVERDWGRGAGRSGAIEGGRCVSVKAAGWSGFWAGLAMLAHPMGIVPTAQAGLVLVLFERGSVRERVGRGLRFGLTAGVVFGVLWGMLIALHADLFWVQFHGNVVGRASGGLAGTLMNPWPVLAIQGRQFLSRALGVQAGLYALGLAWAAWRGRGDSGARRLLLHGVLAFGLLVLFMGRHLILGYFAYPSAFLSVAAGGLLGEAAVGLGRAWPWSGRRWAWWGMTGLVLLSLSPGSGIRTLLEHIKHADRVEYDRGAFAGVVLRAVPGGAKVAADEAWVMEFYLAGRSVVDAHYLDVLREFDWEYLVIGSDDGLRLSGVDAGAIEKVAELGEVGAEFGCWAEVYRRKGSGLRGEAGGSRVRGRNEAGSGHSEGEGTGR